MARLCLLAVLVVCLALVADAPATDARHMLPGERCVGSIQAASEVDQYLLDAIAGTKLKLNLKPWKGYGLIGRMALSRPSGGEIDLGPYSSYPKNGTAHKVKLTLPESGTYTLRVAGSSGSSGVYDLKTKASDPKSIKVTPLLDPTGEVDFSFFALAGSTAKIKAKADAGEPTAPELESPDSSISTPAQTMNGRKVTVKLADLPLTGTYRLKFRVTGGPATDLTIKAKVSPPKVEKDWWLETAFAARGSISGRLIVGAPSDSGKALSLKGRRPRVANESRPGELLVRLASGTIEELIANHAGLDLEVADGLECLRTWLVKVPEGRKPKHRRRAANEARRVLVEDPRVESVEPNGILSAARAPNDPQYGIQWHYHAINLEEAWDVTVGAGTVVVAVVDSGIIAHEDLDENVLPGYDFVSDANLSGDGDGPDTNPTAIGNYHGVHVAGTVGAVSNNGVGIAGVAWRSRILPVRALRGDGRGSSLDIAKAILYAAGVSDPGLPTNPTPARIINLSLGGPGDSSVIRNAVQRAAARGAILVAAAGNSSTSEPHYPAAYPEVISVSAVNPALALANYSNYGSWIDIAGPGGQLSAWGAAGGVLSTYRGQLGEPYTSLQGTSMACPHVAGVVALMLSANPALSVTQVRNILDTTAHDIGDPGDDDLYGAGLIDAGRAVRQAASTPASGPTNLEATPSSLALGPAMSEAWVTLRNLGSGSLTISSISTSTQSGGNWLSATLVGTTAPARIHVLADLQVLQDGTYSGTISVASSAGTQVIPVTLTVASPLDAGPATVYLVDLSGDVVATTTTTYSQSYAFSFQDVPQGYYGLVAAIGYVSDSSLEVNDWFGEWPVVGQRQTIEIGSDGQDVTGASFPVHRLDRIVNIPGVGGGSIKGALSVKVVDANSGRPIQGASVCVRNGVYQGTTDSRGQVLFEGSLSGPQTVTASASGYDLRTYAAMDAQFMCLRLGRTMSPSDYVDLTVRIRGLLWSEYEGIVGVGDESTGFTYDGWNDPIVTLRVPRGRADMIVSAVVLDGMGSLSSIDYAFIGPYTTSSSIDLYPWKPKSVWYTSPAGSVTLPTANFDSSTVIPFMFVFAHFNYEYPLYLGISSPTSTSNYYLEWASISDELDEILPAVEIYAAIDANGSITSHYERDWLADLPGGLHANLMDVPLLSSPADQATIYSLDPTLSFSRPADADLAGLEFKETATGRKWTIVLPGTGSLPAVPSLPSPYFRRGYDYEWKVMAYRLPVFDYDEFRWDHLEAQVGDLSISPTWTVYVR